MNSPLRVLHLEDNVRDAELIYSTLKSAGIHCDPVRVENGADFHKAIKQEGMFDIIISDFSLPSFDGVSALRMAREAVPHIPFIFVSGTLGEDSAIESLVNGATDYVLKDRMGRLVPAVNRAMREAEEKRERKNAQDALHLQTSYFQQLFENLPEGIILVDTEDRVLSANSAFQQMFQYKAGELIGRSINSLIVSPEGKEDAEKITAESARGKVVKRDVVRKKKDGTLVEVMVIGFPIFMDEKNIGVYGVYVDISERKKLEAQFLRSQRLESIGTLAGGIAHDLNNVLGPIMLSLEVMRRRIKDESLQKMIDTLEISAKRGADLIKQVLSFARGVQGTQIPVQVKHLAREVEAIMRQTFPRSITVRTDLPTSAWTVLGDATQLQQVLMNLCVNARDAMPNGGTIEIKLENASLDDQYAQMQSGSSKGQYVAISVKDSGTGIPPEVRDRIFEPFFTTKEPGKGTGLGLSTAHAVVTAHGGFITVYSEGGNGTVFRVYLPAKDVAEETKQVSELEIPRGKGETILVVDDEEAVREITRTTLEAFGYVAVGAADGVEAIARFAEDKKNISLVISDMMMPYMDGRATIRALQRIDRKVKVIAMSGLEQENGGKLNATFIHKPFTAEQLLRSVRTILDS